MGPNPDRAPTRTGPQPGLHIGLHKGLIGGNWFGILRYLCNPHMYSMREMYFELVNVVLERLKQKKCRIRRKPCQKVISRTQNISNLSTYPNLVVSRPVQWLSRSQDMSSGCPGIQVLLENGPSSSLFFQILRLL